MKIRTAKIDGVTVPIGDERNLLELIRKAGTELPTFCYHSDVSVYGACRMCMVEVEGRGLMPACSTEAWDGMVVRTTTKEIRDLRKMIIELMLAAHDYNCTTCLKSDDCKLQQIARQMGVTEVRFKRIANPEPKDTSSIAIIRDPSKCILCGDCVRVCQEIQGVGALNFAYRGAGAKVVTNFEKGLGQVECVNCGQCVKACPVGALVPNYQVEAVWDAIHNPKKTVVAQIAPAVRVAIGEYFGHQPGTINIGQIIASLKRMGFDNVYDTCFGADLTVMEETAEFLERLEKGVNLPLFTSCCPAWVKFAEQYYPDLLPHISTCRSPQQMFGAVCKQRLTEQLGIDREDLVVVSIMPCTAKKFEAARPEFRTDGNPDVDFVLTTQELALMIRESGLDFKNLEPESFDMPLGFATGAAVIFGSSGGVSEAVLRHAANMLQKGTVQDFKHIRSTGDTKVTTVKIADTELRLGVVSGLANARELVDKIRAGEEHFHLVEVMACPGGCVNGGGQPVPTDRSALADRSKGLYDNDKMLLFHVSSDNPYLRQMYKEELSDPDKTHELLHTSYETRRRIEQDDFIISNGADTKKVSINVCFGTSCFIRGSQKLYTDLLHYVEENGLTDLVEFKASFCNKQCSKGPVIKVNDVTLERCTLELALKEVEKALAVPA